MSFPPDLQTALEQLFEKAPQNSLMKASTQLSERYRNPHRDQIPDFMTSDMHRLAYLAVRMPATFAVVRRILSEASHRLPALSPKSICDVGAGPGTASWAAAEVFSGVQGFVLHEKDESLLKIGKRLMQNARHQGLKNAGWHTTDVTKETKLAAHDLVILSYVVGELPIDAMHTLTDRAWQTASQALVVIEPGTPHGFERIRAIRSSLIEKGAYLAAPCPHHKACPMANGDWCHFAQRLERSLLHRKVKDVSMGYEDEKYSYLVAAKMCAELPESRILRHPQHHSGHIDFILCGQSGLEKRILSKKLGSLYKLARKLEWGDSFSYEEVDSRDR